MRFRFWKMSPAGTRDCWNSSSAGVPSGSAIGRNQAARDHSHSHSRSGQITAISPPIYRVGTVDRTPACPMLNSNSYVVNSHLVKVLMSIAWIVGSVQCNWHPCLSHPCWSH